MAHTIAGFQRQTNGRTIQAEMESAIRAADRTAYRVTAAGRTDAGVHARGQVVTFLTTSGLPLADMQRALNALLPPDIAVIEAREVAAGRACSLLGCATLVSLHDTEHACALALAPARAPTTSVVQLNVAAMDQAAQVLVGTHDFAAFGGPMREAGSTIRTDLPHRLCRREGDLIFVDLRRMPISHGWFATSWVHSWRWGVAL